MVHLTAGATADTPARAGFVVGRTVGGAVVRNRVRRQLRHLVRDRLPQLDELMPRAQLVVRALPPAATATSAQLAADLDAALTTAATKLRTRLIGTSR